MQQKTSIKTIGIIGGGQLGRMICFEAHKMGYKTVIFCDKENSPASFVTNNVVIANYDDEAALTKFCDLVDIITFEFENIPYNTVKFLAQKVDLYPNPEVLKIAQNRLLEKTFLKKIDIGIADFSAINNIEDLQKAFTNFGKSILKTTTLGYDGKGQYVLQDKQDVEKAWDLLNNSDLILEKFCPFNLEISVIVARSSLGEIKSYEPVHNIHKNSILDQTIYPALITDAQKKQAQEIAEKIAQEINLIGVLAVEMFVMDNEIKVNELAPRPHNSGHITMDLCLTSQFEQLIKAITGQKLGDVTFFAQGHMKNLIGNEVLDLDSYQTNDRAKIHLYDKSKVVEGRKMGHVNVIKNLYS